MSTWTVFSDLDGNRSQLLERTSDSFGPTAPGRFDFTLLFEDTIFSIVPSVILLLIVPPRIWMLFKQRIKVVKSPLHEGKMLFLGCYAVIQAVLIILWSLSPELVSRATIPAAGLSFVAALALLALSHQEHLRTVRPSAIINVYILFTLLFDAARMRSLWHMHGAKTIAGCFSSSLSIKIFILVTEAMEKRDILLGPFQSMSPELTSGIYSRSMFWWLNNLMRTGFSRLLSNDDLYPVDEEMKTSTLLYNMRKAWNSQNKNSRHALIWATLKATHTSILYCVFPRLCFIGFKYAQPFLIARTVEFASSPEDSDNIGWGLTGAFALVFAGSGIAYGAYKHMTFRFVTTVRGSLVTLIYWKTVDLSITALDESVALTLMATDTETICLSFQNLQELWAAMIEVAIALWLLYRQLGIAVVGPGVVSLLSTAGIFGIANYAGNAQKLWIEGIQTRVDSTSAMLGMMKAVKMLGFSDIMTSIIHNLRVDELELSKAFRRLLCVRVFLANSNNLMGPLFSFAIYVGITRATGMPLDTSQAFSSLSIIALVSEPVSTFIRTIPALNGAIACFARIQKFLLSDVRKDHRLSMRESDSVPLNQMTLGKDNNIELQDLSGYLEQTSELIVARNATFAWSVEGEPVVREANFVIRRNEFTFIIGPVGSGKSSLLKALLGEVPSSKGFIYSSALNAGYVEQTPWIQNASVRDNIIGVSNYEEAWYTTVVRACALEQDVRNMPKGHNTQVGSAGISLSGGQKQRIALARAVYARQSLVILDDVFSGLDAQTEERVFSRLLGRQGLFRKNGISVLLVTHAVHRLPYSDHIIALNAHGQIAEQGTYGTLLQAGGYVQNLAATAKEESTDDVEEVEDVPQPFVPQEIGAIRTEIEELNRKTGEIAVYKYYFKSFGYWSCLFYFSLVVICGGSASLTQLVVTYWTTSAKQYGNEVNDFYLGMYALLVALATISLTLLAWYHLVVMVPTCATTLHARLLKTVMSAPLSFFTTTDTGTTTNRFSQDMTVVDVELPYAFIDLTIDIMLCTMGAVLMCLSAGYFAIVMPAVMLLVWILQKYYLRTSRQIRLLDLEAKSPLYSHFIESLSGLTTIRAFGWAEIFQERNFELLDTSQKPYYLLFCIQRWLALILDMLVAGLAVILMALIVKLRNDISAGYVGLALLNVMSFNQSLAQIIQNWTALETSLGAISRLRNFNVQTISENLPNETVQPPESWPAHGAIEIRNITAAYTADGTPVVKNLSMSIRAGEKVGICGRSGSGKSSLISAIFRMLELQDSDSTSTTSKTNSSEPLSTGTIVIDGIDLLTLPRQLIRSTINAIPQEPYFLKGSVRLNADPRSQHTDSAIIEALTKVKLWDLVQAKGGLSAPLDTEFFSHGQRQLFCLARALLRGGRILVLDEATSSVDVASDALMQRVIREEFAGATVIAVAHRLNTILDFDRVAVLADGELKEFDSPEVLLGRRSMFRELCES